jgi:hypothetical protein
MVLGLRHLDGGRGCFGLDGGAVLAVIGSIALKMHGRAI